MIDFKLRFDTEDQANEYLQDIGILDEELNIQIPIISIDTIGIIYDVDLTKPEEPVSTPIDGWHINLRVAYKEGMQDPFNTDPLVEFMVSPKTPIRVWA